jgi:anaerobic selenocysteine-containing dehydrogenase
MLERFEKTLGIEAPRSPGYDTMACMDAAYLGKMDFTLQLGGNLYGSNPNARRAFDAMQKIKTIVYMSTTLNTGHAWGTGEETFILPVLPRDEEPQTTTQESMFSYVRLSDGGPSRHQNARSEVSILAEIGQKIFAGDSRLDWSKMQSHQAIRELIADLIPGYEDLKSIGGTKTEFHVPGRAVTGYKFPTASGKAKFIPTELPESNLSSGQLRLMTMRSEGQFNSVVYDEEDLYRGQERRDVVLMNRDDIGRLGFKPEQRVRIRSEAGEMRYILVREFDIRAGNVAMYYPESNVLVPSAVDPLSKTPAFKSIAVTLDAEPD